ncbi:hypothetical protein [Streptomyces sp. NBC_01207]|uniref:hypothetical protein n=1 Tax=Streptomyces sp. NBC_01207 TaxID=2903772 RepID=UPI002E0F7143|nr:hypothetical protein OG457_30565 [Streptomyces sp. NBC_01207]
MSNIDIGSRLAALERQIAALQRSSRLGHSSIENAAIEVYDDSGSLRAVIGQQADGTSGVVAVNGPQPPQPSRPYVASVLGGISVTWDGTFLEEVAPPLDFSRVEIHIGATDGFIISETTLRATIESPRGGTLFVAASTPMYFRLMARTTSGTASDPSPQAGPMGPAAVVAQEVLDGIITETALAEEAVGRMHLQVGAVGHTQLGIGAGNLLPDPGFEGPYTDQNLTGKTGWSLATGNNSARALQAGPKGPPPSTGRALRITELAVSPGDRFFLAVDYRVSMDWTGDSIRLFMEWQDAQGGTLSYGILAVTPAPGAPWARANRQVQAPAGAAKAAVWIKNHEATTGTADFDNAEVRTVIGAGMVLADSIGTPELAAGSVVASKVAAKTLTAREVKALSLTGAEMATNFLAARHVAAGTLNATHLAIGVDGNLISDPSFEGAVTTGRLATDWTVVAPGRDSPKALRVDCTSATPVDKTITLGTFPAMPGQRVWLSADYQLSTDWVGTRANAYVRWEDAAGAVLAYSRITSGSAAAGSNWKTMSGAPETAAPAQTVLGRIKLAADDSKAGSVLFDNVTCRIVIGSQPSGTRAEISPAGLVLFDEGGDERVSLVTGRANFLTLSGTNGGAVATIDEKGNAGFNDVSVAGGLTVGGIRLDSRLAESPRGLVAISRQYSAVTGSANEMGFVELAFQADPSRMYRIVVDCYVTASSETGEVHVALRDGGTSTPTVSSPVVQSRVFPISGLTWRPVRVELIRSGASLGAGLHRILSTFHAQWAPDGTTVTLFGKSDQPAHMYVEDVGPAIPDTGVYNTGGGVATPPKQQYERTYAASWSGSYANRGAFNSFYGSQCIQGYYSSNNGVQAALIGFPSSLGSDLAGASIQRVELYLYYAHWYYNAGGKAVIKAHGHASRPASFSCDSDSQTIDWGKNVGMWIDITGIFDSTSWRGVALDPANSSLDYYGRAEGVGEGHPPQLKVTYVK